MLLIQIIELITLTWASVLLLRFFLQRGGLSVSHPLAQLSMTLTDWIARPARKIIRPVKGWDTALPAAAFVVLLLVQMALIVVRLAMGGSFQAAQVPYAVMNSVLYLTQAAAYALIACLIIQMVLSFAHPYNPLMNTVCNVLRPFTYPFRFLRIGRIDFSGSLIFIALWLYTGVAVPYLRYLLRVWLF